MKEQLSLKSLVNSHEDLRGREADVCSCMHLETEAAWLIARPGGDVEQVIDSL